MGFKRGVYGQSAFGGEDVISAHISSIPGNSLCSKSPEPGITINTNILQAYTSPGTVIPQELKIPSLSSN